MQSLFARASSCPRCEYKPTLLCSSVCGRCRGGGGGSGQSSVEVLGTKLWSWKLRSSHDERVGSSGVGIDD
eukprot:1567953-Pyramimonas_sp.AAC.1